MSTATPSGDAAPSPDARRDAPAATQRPVRARVLPAAAPAAAPGAVIAPAPTPQVDPAAGSAAAGGASERSQPAILPPVIGAETAAREERDPMSFLRRALPSLAPAARERARHQLDPPAAP